MRRVFFVYIPLFFIFTTAFVASFNVLPKGVYAVPIFGPSAVLLLLSVILFMSARFVVKKFTGKYFNKDSFIAALLFFFFNYNFYGMVPFNSSRSNSIILLSYLNSAPDLSRTKSEAERFVMQKYFVDYDAVGKRLAEQVDAGNITYKDGGYQITNRGRLVIDTFAIVTDLYGVANNFAKKSEIALDPDH